MAKHKKETLLFIDGYCAGLKDNSLSNKIIEQQDFMLLNAHQLVKNGIAKPWLKFEEFKELMKFEYDHNGKRVSKFI